MMKGRCRGDAGEMRGDAGKMQGSSSICSTPGPAVGAPASTERNKIDYPPRLLFMHFCIWYYVVIFRFYPSMLKEFRLPPAGLPATNEHK